MGRSWVLGPQQHSSKSPVPICLVPCPREQRCPHGWENLWKALRVACGTAFRPTTGSRRILFASWSLVSPAALTPPQGPTKTAVRPGLGCTVRGMRGHSGGVSTRRAQTPKGPAPPGAPGTQCTSQRLRRSSECTDVQHWHCCAASQLLKVVACPPDEHISFPGSC